MTDHPVERALGAETFARLRNRLKEANALIRERGIREYEGRSSAAPIWRLFSRASW